MTDEIRPALTPKEWEEALRYTVREVLITGVEFFVSSEDTAFAVMAELNAALPDDDPRKITRADVEFIRMLIERHRHSSSFDRDNPVYAPGIVAQGDALADKLAALLPPDDGPNLTRSGP